MKPLSKELRNKFERTIENAREIAEEAARVALEQLGVGEASPYSYLSEHERALRRRLRAHGRNLGDVRDSKTEIQEIERLVEEIAYEHWHRMLFARFLSENDLLMYYDDDDIMNAVPVTLSECEELAEELGLKNGWEMAAKLATKMLPQVFRADSPVFVVVLSPEKQRQLENLVSNIDHDVFKASDSIGWAYQFWQNKRKEIINKAETKIGEQELPAVTQIFTEDYMVEFLLDNSIGMWWAKQILTDDILINAKTENELRKLIEVNGYLFKNLRLSKYVGKGWNLTGENKFELPDNPSELRIIDPSCGSGHFLVAALLILIPIRMTLEKISPETACDSIIIENLYGLEIDQRCVEIAAFSVALTAWRYPGTSGFRRLPDLNIAWCGQAINMSKDEWTGYNTDQNMKIYLESIYELFKHASILGSLINPAKLLEEGSMFENFKMKINEYIKSIVKKEENNEHSFSINAKGIEKVLSIITQKYHLVVTNVPYLVRGKQNEILKEYCDNYYSDAKKDLATVFLMRCLEFTEDKGNCSIVLPQNWMLSYSYKNLRKHLLKNESIIYLVRLGSGAFSTISGEIVKVVLLSITRSSPKNNHNIWEIDVSTKRSIDEKAEGIRKLPIKVDNQIIHLSNPNSRIIFNYEAQSKLMKHFAKSTEGLSTGDSERYLKFFWEINQLDRNIWEYYQMSPSDEGVIDGLTKIIFWQNGNGELSKNKSARIQGHHAWNKPGVIVGRVGNLRPSIYLGVPFDKSAIVLTPHDNSKLSSIYSFTSNSEFKEEVRLLDKNLGVATSVFENIPFMYKKYIQNSYIIELPNLYSDDPTQWIFHGHPRKSVEPLQVALARLLGYRWPSELDSEMELSYEAKALVEESEGLLSFADKDGIVCIPSVRGEAPASERLLNLLAAAYKDEDINVILPGLLSDANHTGKSLESWLRDKFFSQHYKLFGYRPFIWQIWDGLKDGFSALVNYHMLDRKNLETLIYTYLGDWISKQESDMVDGIEGAEEKLNAAISLKKKLELILEGKAPYDIFIRWKPLNKQPLGWEPDLNDGVRINIRPFMSVGDVGKKGAGVLRDKANIKWTKDRGKDTANNPWYHLFGGDRINDHHLTLEEKKKAREEMR